MCTDLQSAHSTGSGKTSQPTVDSYDDMVEQKLKLEKERERKKCEKNTLHYNVEEKLSRESNRFLG